MLRLAMPDTQPSASEPSLVGSLVRVVEAGEHVVLDRVDLLRFDLSELASRTVGGAVLIGVGAFLLTGAWFTFIPNRAPTAAVNAMASAPQPRNTG
jgi:hypothetical protein